MPYDNDRIKNNFRFLNRIESRFTLFAAFVPDVFALSCVISGDGS